MVDTCNNIAMSNSNMLSNQSNTNNGSLISQGAEGRLFLSELFGQRCVIKERFSKKYRVPALDEKLTKSRML